MIYYKLLEHTADLGIRVWGKDLREIFLHSASAMYNLLSETSLVNSKQSVYVEIVASDKDELLRNWLAELLYYFHAKQMLFCEFNITSLSNNKIASVIKGEKIDYTRHLLKREIKAVTFHNLRIEKQNSRLETDIIFDV